MNMKSVIAIILFVLICAVSASGQVAVIANKSVSVGNIKKSDLLNFYTGDIKKWSDMQPIVVFDLKTKGEVKENFYNFLGKSSSRMKAIWMKKMLSGEGYPPESMKSEEDLLKKVASTPGAIGYISQAAVNEEVKILMVVDEAKKQEQ